MTNLYYQANSNIIRTKLGKGGRIIIPSRFRKNLNLSEGDDIVLQMQNNNICISTAQSALKRLQDKVKELDSNISLVNQLITERRLDAKNE